MVRFISRKISGQDRKVKAQQPVMRIAAEKRAHLDTTSCIKFAPSALHPPHLPWMPGSAMYVNTWSRGCFF